MTALKTYRSAWLATLLLITATALASVPEITSDEPLEPDPRHEDIGATYGLASALEVQD